MTNTARRKPKISDLPSHLRGPAQNRFGGHRTQNMKAYRGNTFGAASDCIVFTKEQKQEWISNHTSPTHADSR